MQNIQTTILPICYMTDYMERNNFVLRSAIWKWLLHWVKCVWKWGHKNLAFKRQKLYEKDIHQIVATNGHARFCIVTHRYVALFLRKLILCQTNNIFYSQGNHIWHKMNSIFHNFACLCQQFLCLNSFAWKRDWLISQKVQMPKTSSGPF